MQMVERALEAMPGASGAARSAYQWGWRTASGGGEGGGDGALVGVAELGDRQAQRAGDVKRVAADLTDHAGAGYAGDRLGRPGDHEATGPLAEERGLVAGGERDLRPHAALHAALRQRHREPAVGHVVHRGERTASGRVAQR